MPPPRWEPTLCDALGVTRIARVTSLDRSGVEVACAVRPGGHVLQVCNGKGRSWDEARRGALFESVELHAAEHVEPRSLIFASARELAVEERLWGPHACGSAGWFVDPALWSEDLELAWVRARSLFDDGGPLVPAQVVFCLPSGTVDLGPIVWAWASNGLAAHTDRDAAVVHAILEAAERDQLARALPDGWTTEVILSRRLTSQSLRSSAPAASALAESIAARGFEVALFDLSPSPGIPGALPLATAGALLLDLEPSPVPLTAGYACRLDRDDALVAALLEAAQSRLTDIHGAREDVRGMRSEDVDLLRNLLRSAGASRSVTQMRGASGSRRHSGLREVLLALRRGGVREAACVDLPGPVPGVHVARVIVPSFVVSELLV